MAKKERGNRTITTSSESEKRFFADVSQILKEGRSKAHTAVNFAMVETYWSIGRRIVEQEQQGKERANYGDQLLVNLSRYLTSTLGKGFSVANLWNFRQFFLTWPNDEILYTLCRELSWSHVRLIMRLDDEKTREYYLRETRAEVERPCLGEEYPDGYFKQIISSQKSDLPAKIKTLMSDGLMKDPYVLNFPENPTPKERSIETAIVNFSLSYHDAQGLLEFQPNELQ